MQSRGGSCWPSGSEHAGLRQVAARPYIVGVPPRSRPANRRSELLSAARTVFGKKGYDGATVSEIVGRAGVAQGTFYLYFPGKDALAGAFAETLAMRFAQLADEKTSRSRSFDAA